MGRTLIQAVHHQGRWVALLVWGLAALKLTDRDADIGWTDSQRAERIGLVVQNRRFLVLTATRMPNLASRSLALAVNALPAAWEQAHGNEKTVRGRGPTHSGHSFDHFANSRATIMSVSLTPGANPPSVWAARMMLPSRMNSTGEEPQ